MELIKLENVQILEKAEDWRQAIRISVEPLERSGYVKSCYKDEIIHNLEELGPYIVIADDIAMPHARPEQGAIETQISITLFRHGVQFDGKDTTARLFVTLAAKDSDSHLKALMQISELLSDEDQVKAILSAKDAEELYQYFKHI